MKFLVFLCTVIASVLMVKCSHTFMGTSVMSNQVFHKQLSYASRTMQKRVENFTYNVPSSYYGRRIQGILAYDLTNSGASANVTSGGLGYSFVTLRMKSDRGRKLNYDVHIYV